MLANRHNLFQWEQPIVFLQRVFRVYPHEVKLLLWVTAIQMAMRISSIMINNYAHTAFLKRFGVEYLPTIFVIEAILTFFVTSAVGILMNRHRTLRVFTGLLLFFALSVGIIRGLLPFEIVLIYPILYILKSQAVEILPILYWDILNDLFTTQQSKRLFTLIIAGGILGTALGSFMTGTVARWVGVDNVLLIFAGGMVVAALLNEATERVVGAPLETRVDRPRAKHRRKFTESLQDAAKYSKQSPLLRYMILIIAIPNIILPILTYQFSVVVNDTYATEQATLQFFGIFRGVSNAVMFGILLFSGRLLAQWGVATSLLFHPINYLLSFASLFFRFDIFSAVYARFSTETLKTTLNNPARAVLYNFFPAQMRGLIRVFLRGTVVRAADLSGSGLLMLAKGLLDPRLLSIVAAPLVFIWIYMSMRIKRSYPSLLMHVLKEKQIDWEHLEEAEFQALARDKRTLETLLLGLKDEDPEVALLCGESLAQIAPPGWTKWIVEALPGRPPEFQKALLDLLEPEDAREIMDELLRMAREASPEVLEHLIPTLMRLDPKASLQFMEELVVHPDPMVRVHALMALYCSKEVQAQEIFRRSIREFSVKDVLEVQAAEELPAEAGHSLFDRVLLQWARGEDVDLRVQALHGLAKMRHVQAMEIALGALEEFDPRLRQAAADVILAPGTQTPLEVCVRLLSDEDPRIREKTSYAVVQRGEDVVRSLLPALASPSRVLRNEIISILEKLGAPRVELSQFINRQLAHAYRNLSRVRSLQAIEDAKVIPLLRDHLLEKNNEILEIVLRVLAVHEFEDEMEVILRALKSGDRRDMDNAIEALETHLHSKIREIFIPLLQDMPLEEKLALGDKGLGTGLMGLESPGATLISLLEDDDAVTQALALYALGEYSDERPPRDLIFKCLDSKDSMVREAASWALSEFKLDVSTEEYPVQRPDLVERALRIRKIPIFENLGIRELLAIAAISTARSCSKDEVVVREADPGDALYLIVEGEMSIIKGMRTRREVILDLVREDDFFGEMALIDSKPRSASVRAESEAFLLVIERTEFTRVMEEYPSVPINICKVFCQRIRDLQSELH